MNHANLQRAPAVGPKLHRAWRQAVASLINMETDSTQPVALIKFTVANHTMTIVIFESWVAFKIEIRIQRKYTNSVSCTLKVLFGENRSFLSFSQWDLSSLLTWWCKIFSNSNTHFFLSLRKDSCVHLSRATESLQRWMEPSPEAAWLVDKREQSASPQQCLARLKNTFASGEAHSTFQL